MVRAKGHRTDLRAIVGCDEYADQGASGLPERVNFAGARAMACGAILIRRYL
jgi:hypothetical protein